MAYARHGVAEIATARADVKNLNATTRAILAALESARARGAKIALFVTGIPGAGKTLCGLNTAFGAAADATFLTGNPTLVHVLREALVRDAVAQGHGKRAAQHKMQGKIQALPHFRNEYVVRPECAPPERVAVIDEAQRCWSRDYAVRKTADKSTKLSDSEPGHLLDIMARHDGFAACLCLIGGGQEIHDGEGGIAEWGQALATRPEWEAVAPPEAAMQHDTRQNLGPLPRLIVEPQLHLDVPVRQIRNASASDWVGAALRGDVDEAQIIAARTTIPFLLTRDLAEARRTARALARGKRRAGLLASSDGRRLRAEGLGSEVPHMDADAVARWFLDRYPDDVRASDALELVATEFSCQGLELDIAVLCWDADLIRRGGEQAWQPRCFRGTRWQSVRGAEAISNHLNTYRVLLTRARYETIIFVPHGAEEDATRDPSVYDAIAGFLQGCGARPLAPADSSVCAHSSSETESVLL